MLIHKLRNYANMINTICFANMVSRLALYPSDSYKCKGESFNPHFHIILNWLFGSTDQVCSPQSSLPLPLFSSYPTRSNKLNAIPRSWKATVIWSMPSLTCQNFSRWCRVCVASICGVCGSQFNSYVFHSTLILF